MQARDSLYSAIDVDYTQDDVARRLFCWQDRRGLFSGTPCGWCWIELKEDYWLIRDFPYVKRCVLSPCITHYAQTTAYIPTCGFISENANMTGAAIGNKNQFCSTYPSVQDFRIGHRRRQRSQATGLRNSKRFTRKETQHFGFKWMSGVHEVIWWNEWMTGSRGLQRKRKESIVKS